MKNIQKSIRLTEETYNLLMSMSGVGLSEKIETLVNSYINELPKMEKEDCRNVSVIYLLLMMKS